MPRQQSSITKPICYNLHPSQLPLSLMMGAFLDMGVVVRHNGSQLGEKWECPLTNMVSVKQEARATSWGQSILTNYHLPHYGYSIYFFAVRWQCKPLRQMCALKCNAKIYIMSLIIIIYSLNYPYSLQSFLDCFPWMLPGPLASSCSSFKQFPSSF